MDSAKLATRYLETRRRQPTTPMKAMANKVVSRYLTAKKAPFNTEYIKLLRKEFLTLMKNAKVIKDYKHAMAWREVMVHWRERFDDLVYTRLVEVIGNLPLQYEWVSRDEAKKWEKYVQTETWDLHINLSIPISRTDDYWSEGARFSQFQTDLKKWDGRVRRASRKAWKALEGFVSWYRHTTSHEPFIDAPSSEQVNLEGFQVLVKDYNGSDMAVEALGRFKQSLKNYKKRAQAVLPLLLQQQLPMAFDYKKGLSTAGEYRGRYIDINPKASYTESVDKMTKTIAHEMGHHLWRTSLSGEARQFWEKLIYGNYGKLDLRDVLKRYGSERSFSDNDRIRREDPILYLQIDGLYTSYKHVFLDGGAILSMDDLREYLEEGGQAIWSVHGKPITGYAHKNPEEAFCEVIGMLVAYGPRAVLPEVRSWIRVVLPQIKVAKKYGYGPQTALPEFRYLKEAHGDC